MRYGYTLIELLVTTTLITVLVTFGISAYSKAANSNQVKVQAEQILSDLATAQKNVSVGNSECDGVYLGEKLDFSSGTGTYTVTSVCENDQVIRKTTTLSTATFANNYSFTFRTLSQGIDLGNIAELNLDFLINEELYRYTLGSAGSIHYLGKI